MLTSFLPRLSLLVAVALYETASSVPVKRAAGPVRVLDTNFADPCIFQESDGSWLAFATSGNGVNIQVAKSPDFATWTLQTGVDALKTPLPSWIASTPNTWAPDVVQVADGSFVMYFAAASSQDATKHCVGVATSTAAGGPYTVKDSAFACPLDEGGAIDPDGYLDGNTRYVVYKIDGNSLNGDGTTHPTPLRLQQVGADGFTASGSPIDLLDRDDGDGPLIEAPSLAKGGDTYYLFFSSNRYDTKLYDVSYATATAITGPFTKVAAPNAPLLQSGDSSSAGALGGPGGADVSTDGTKLAFHAFENGETIADGRAMYVSGLSLSGGVASIT
ncbi:MAG: hypothetical protein M4579_000210 [Chaenotheca gracillima]|nr:MAG: hypothetical protein M4579_000210 [Chaenotheca gracillima]